MAALNLPADGGCRCGQLRFRVTLPPIMTSVCHCAGCRRMSGSAFSTTAMIPGEGFEVTAGDSVPGGLRGPRLLHRHCADCHGWVYTAFADNDAYLNLRATLLDDVAWFEPFVESCAAEKLAWVDVPTVHSFPQFPPPEMRLALIAEYAETLGSKEI